MIILIILILLLLAMAVVVLLIRRKHKMPQGIEIYNEYGEKILSTDARLTRSLMCVPCTSWTGSAKVIGKQKDTTYLIRGPSLQLNLSKLGLIKIRCTGNIHGLITISLITIHWLLCYL